MTRRAFALALLWTLPLLAHTTATAQRVWVVGPSNPPPMNSLQAAIATVSDGDIILVEPGTYGTVPIIGKGLTIASRTGIWGDVQVTGIFIANTSAAQPVTLIGLHSDDGLDANTAVGRIHVHDCHLETPRPNHPGVRCESCASVALVGCAIDGFRGAMRFGGDGVAARNSTLHVYACTVRGGRNPNTFAPSEVGDGLLLESSTAFASNSTFEGGPSYFDSRSSSCVPGGAGARIDAGSTLVEQACVFRGLSMNGCAPGPWRTGTTPQSLTTQPVIFRAPDAISSGTIANLDIDGVAGALVYLTLSYNAAPVYVPWLNGTLFPALPLAVAPIGVIPLGGTLTYPVRFRLPSGQRAAMIHAQAVAWDGADLVLSNPRPLSVYHPSL